MLIFNVSFQYQDKSSEVGGEIKFQGGLVIAMSLWMTEYEEVLEPGKTYRRVLFCYHLLNLTVSNHV